MQYQATLRDAFSVEGVGLHTGVPCRVDVRPAAAGSGLTFVSRGVRIPALAEYVVETARATVLGRDDVTVSTVEHLLSALLGAGVSNAEIGVDGPEIPVADGSSRAFLDAVTRVGLAAQPEVRARFAPSAPLFMRDGDRVVVVLPAATFRVKFIGDFAPPIGAQYFDGEMTPANYDREIAAARTFGYLHEVQALLARGLAQGGTLENAVVYAPDGPMQSLRWPNEVIRHKILDLIGDLALIGAWPQCEVIAVKSGHKLHCMTSLAIRRELQAHPAASATNG